MCVCVFQVVEETAAKAGSEASPSQEVQQELTKAQEELNKAREERNTLKEEVQKKQEEVSMEIFKPLLPQYSALHSVHVILQSVAVNLCEPCQRTVKAPSHYAVLGCMKQKLTLTLVINQKQRSLIAVRSTHQKAVRALAAKSSLQQHVKGLGTNCNMTSATTHKKDQQMLKEKITKRLIKLVYCFSTFS